MTHHRTHRSPGRSTRLGLPPRPVLLLLLLPIGFAPPPLHARAAGAEGRPDAVQAPRPEATTAPATPAGQTAPAAPAPQDLESASRGSLALSLDQAITRGLDHNLHVLLAQAGQDIARGRRWQSLASLRPSVAGSVSEDRQKLNLAAFGLPVAEGESPLVGPFDVFDARFSVHQALFDRPASQHAHAASATLASARDDVRDARDLVVLVVARLYLGVLADRARLEAADAEVATAQALADLAHDQLQAGTVAKIDVLRSQVELDTRRQQRIVAANDLEKDKLALARAIGLPLDRPIDLTDPLPDTPAAPLEVAAAVQQAQARRADLASARSRLEAARAEVAAARGERLPSVALRADWGTIGPRPSSALTTYDLGAVVSVPLSLGGRIHGEVLEAEAQVRQEQERLDDLERRIEYEVRGALLDLDAARHRVTTAEAARDLADEQLTEARDRFRAGVSDSLEVVQAQQAVAAAHESYIASLYAFNLAKVTLARALGVAEERTVELLEGAR